MSEQIKDGGAAFPVKNAATWDRLGMSLRDYFAAKALPTILEEIAVDHRKNIIDKFTVNEIAKMAYQMADAMILARESQS